MPRGSEELTNVRKEEIIRTCGSLYETMSFKDITIKEIGQSRYLPDQLVLMSATVTRVPTMFSFGLDFPLYIMSCSNPFSEQQGLF